jgi:protein-export membrane protein SecD
MAKLKEAAKIRYSLIAILVVTIGLLMFNFPGFFNVGINWFNSKLGITIPNISAQAFHLGLDLQGGTHLVYEADTSKVAVGEEAEAIEGVRGVIERRVNALGVSEPIVQTNRAGGKWRVIVELAGVKDSARAIEMIGETPLLEFKEVNNVPARELTATEKSDLESFNKTAEKNANSYLTSALRGEDFVTLVKDNSDDIYTKEQGGDIGLVTATSTGYTEIYSALSVANVEAGKVYDKVITAADGYNIVKVTDVHDGETQVEAKHLLICYKGATSCDSDLSKSDALKKIEDLKNQATTENFEDLVKKNSTEPGAETSGGTLGWFGPGAMVESFDKAVFAMKTNEISDVVETEFGYHLIFKTGEKVTKQYKVSRLLVATKDETDILPPQDPWLVTGLSGKQLTKARVEFDPNTNEPMVGIEFNDEGKKLFSEITTRNVGRQVAIFLDGEVISAPSVNEPITDGAAVIMGSFNLTEAKLLSQRLNAGALPVPVTLIGQQVVGSTQGDNVLNSIVFAGLIGALFIGIFMTAFYRLPGFLSVIALIVYSTIVLFIFKAVPVTLTMSGIAGVIMSLGMAVDANVLIFSRLREEILLGKPLGSAIEEGFKRAWPSIRDSNVSTLITCFVLIWFGDSMIKGFAITLSVGVIVSMFSALTVTRLLMRQFVKVKNLEGKLWLFGISKKSFKEVK